MFSANVFKSLSLATRTTYRFRTLRFLSSNFVNTDTYTHGHAEAVVRQHKARTVYNSAAYLIPKLKKGLTVLDVGCGPGSISAGFAEIVGETGKVFATDCSADILDEARISTAAYDNVTVENADVYELPYDNHSFDVAHAHQVLQHLTDPVRAMREMKRVVKPGGVVACRDADYSTMLGSPDLEFIKRWNEIYKETCRRNNAEPDAGRYLFKWARESGSAASNIEYSADVVVYSPTDPTFQKAWGNAWAERSLNSAFGRQAIEYGISTKEEMMKVAIAWQEWAKDKDATFYYVNGQVLITV
uniref:Methyltransferase domain-containing protein n=1 Tax=Aplanochytrium stocchinoi TaxID=215587 RepID=A0A7S3PGI3_9STRA|mmetsp:Transcript_5127/g.6472  ORF Transcript_5127/g.6472 Transcript_5127/m.6472 type:complete len:301 (+) Transcript_5127:240-1142(+)|eukprot:CAMPEP_0204829974 /NCGR_PEP_ID=MMETSP1346-20131115/8250_1 /ASSEMBLY_ACC=CAM_ASM_000771 /TAXON_ID=215587 /ORGANISM="Aplanochytrium stocchinoi, Strain GSBS06" /LENGTH=300 /DNA_ID=CAMNT_0051960073 /DNA_START=137 /DNA_END=1039 /DNA_ORIENTATION=-